MKHTNRKKKPIIYMQDFKSPFIFGMIITLLFACTYWGVCSWNTNIELAGINISFGITFAAFSITALSLMALLQNTESGKVLEKTGLYKNIVMNYRNSIFMSFLLLIIGIFGELVFSVIDGKVLVGYNLFSVFFIVFLSSYLFINVQALIKMLLYRKGNTE